MYSVSIVLPTFNRGAILDKALSYICNQDYFKLEIVVFDNCSSDNTQNIIKHFSKNDKRVKNVCSKKHFNATEVFKTALKYASGDFVLFAADDDYIIDSTYISKAMNLAKKDHLINLLYSGYIVKNLNSDIELKRVDINESKIWNGIEYWENHYPHDVLETIFIFNRKQYINFQKCNPKSKSILENLFKIALDGKVAAVPSLALQYHMHDQSTSTYWDKNLWNNFPFVFNNVNFLNGVTEHASLKNISENRIRKWANIYYEKLLIDIYSKYFSEQKSMIEAEGRKLKLLSSLESNISTNNVYIIYGKNNLGKQIQNLLTKHKVTFYIAEDTISEQRIQKTLNEVNLIKNKKIIVIITAISVNVCLKMYKKIYLSKVKNLEKIDVINCFDDKDLLN